MPRLIIAALICLAIPVVAAAAEFRDFPEFRYTSGLPGGGNGVTPDGHIGFDGAMQVNIPVGYTPGWGNFMLTADVAAVNGGFPDGFSGANNNGSLTFGLGLLKSPKIWYSHMATGLSNDNLEPVQNIQVEVVPESKNWPGISVGVVDILNRRAATLERPFEGAARSFYVVATREAGTEDNPLYYTLGFGNGRFHDRPFGGISYQPAERFKVLAEYDGWVGNVAAAYDVVRSKEWHGIFTLGLVDFSRVDLMLSVTKTSF